MKELLINAVALAAIAGQLTAQNSAGNPASLSLGIVLVAPGSPYYAWVDPPPCPGHAGRRFNSFGYACDPLYANNKADGIPAASISFTLPRVLAAPAAPDPPPATPPRSEVHEYHWPSSGSDSSPTTFSIVSKDGRVQSATMIWVQDGTVCYLTPDGGMGRAPIGSIDRQPTRQRNGEKQLTWLPAGD